MNNQKKTGRQFVWLSGAHADVCLTSSTDIQNDALLHRLIHTKLLSGSLNPELDLTPAERKKALAGRVLELSGGSKLGKGERAVRETERNKAAKRVREGLLDKKKERERKELEEVSDQTLCCLCFILNSSSLWLGQKLGKLSSYS